MAEMSNFLENALLNATLNATTYTAQQQSTYHYGQQTLQTQVVVQKLAHLVLDTLEQQYLLQQLQAHLVTY